MWICLNNAFLSIVHKDCRPDELLVRARRPGDISRVFPEADVYLKNFTDYQFRAIIKRSRVAEVIADHVAGIDYKNFKDSVEDDELHDAYAEFWSIHATLQPTFPYSMHQWDAPSGRDTEQDDLL